MRAPLVALLMTFAALAPAAAAGAAAEPGPAAAVPRRVAVPLPAPYEKSRPHPQFTRCCRDKVWDRDGKEMGDVIGYVPLSAGTVPTTAIVAYHIAGGDAVILQISPEMIMGFQGISSMQALFTTPDCSGTDMYAAIGWPPLEKRHALVLLTASTGSFVSATHAWLFVTDPLPMRAPPPPGTVFHSSWSEQGACAPIAAPGYTPNLGSLPGFRMHRVEDLLAKFHRPFSIDY